jgi:hypothetical protein
MECWVKTYNNQFGDERYNVLVSTTDATPSSFVALTTQPEAAPSEWTLRSYDLSAYVNRDVYVAIQCVTNDGFIFMIDDIAVTSSLGTGDQLPAGKWNVYPNPASDYLMIGSGSGDANDLSVSLFDPAGRRMTSLQDRTDPGRITLDIRSLPAGAYLLKIGGKRDEWHKVIITR